MQRALFLCVKQVSISEDAMAKVIEFYIPRSFRKSSKWFPAGQQGKLLEFSPPARKSA
jgi:hypothetical protein